MISKVLTVAAISVAVYFAVALGLIVSQRPGPLPEREGLDFSRIIGGGTERASLETRSFTAREGQALTYANVSAPGAEELPLVIMLHGSGWYHGQFAGLARALRDVAEVKALTLRGHGTDPARRGDVDYTGQLEDDIADFIAQSGGRDGRRVILLGHSSGGGLAVRFAGGAHGALADGIILLAPFLKHDAPTTRPNSGGWAHVLMRRVIGLSMLNNVGITALDHLRMIQFAIPRAVLEGPLGAHATTRYSWRLNKSYAPRNDYLGDVAVLPPFLVIAGRDDEAFDAEGYAPVMGAVTDKGRYQIVDGAGHLDIVDSPQTEALVRDYLLGLD